jgi:lysophospholipase L1-like esterase
MRTGRIIGIAAITTLSLSIVAALGLIAGSRAAGAQAQPVATFVPAPSASASASPTPSATPSATATTSSGPYRVVGLGDSVPAGTACGCTTYVSLVGAAEAAKSGTTASVSNLAVAGETTSGLLDQLKETGVRRAVAAADLVIVTIGANDFDEDAVTGSDCDAPSLDCYQSTLATQAKRLTTVLKEIGSLQKSGTVLVTGYWNVFLAGPVGAANGSAYVRNSDALTVADNTQIESIAQAQGDTYVDIYSPFAGTGGSLLAADGDHPDAAGHRAIAKALEAAL